MKAAAIGDKIAPFELLDQHGKTFRLVEHLGHGPIVVFFYPKDDTTVCTKEVCAFRDAGPDFAAAGARVVGISGDSVQSHRSFAGNHALTYPLLADAQGRVRNEIFGVPKGAFGLASGRVTYVLDGEGIVRHIHNGFLQAQAHVDEALQAVRSIARRS